MKNNKKKILLLSLVVIVLAVSLSGCAMIRDKIGLFKGQLIGQAFDILVYDHYGNKIVEMEADKVNIELLENKSNIDESSEGFKSGVLELTINGKQMFQVGNTMVFAEKGLDMVEEFAMPEHIDVDSGGTLVPLDRFINDYANKIGKEKTIVISSPKGIPIGLYQGKKVYVEVPNDLPKMTRLNIDGKSLYIHRANYLILDTDMLE